MTNIAFLLTNDLFIAKILIKFDTLKPKIMKDKTAKEILFDLYGDKETYEKYEVLQAMIEYAVLKLNIQHEKNLQILKEAFND